MAKFTGTISVTDLDLFKDIILLLQDLAQKDESVGVRLAEIMTKHSTEYEYTYTREGD